LLSIFQKFSLLITTIQYQKKRILKKINKNLNPYDWIPNHKF
jgi:hypothetical protein